MQKRCVAEEFGVTAKYWMLHVRIIELTHQLHFTINIKDYHLLLETWEELMVLSFTTNKQNYARYDTYCQKQMGSLNSTHPEAYEEIQEKRFSVCRNDTGINWWNRGTDVYEELKDCRKLHFISCVFWGDLFWGGKHFSVCNSWTTRIVLSRTIRIYLSLYYLIEGNYIGV